MVSARQPARDPRTVARDIPGIFDALFPQLLPGVVAHFNREYEEVAGCIPIANELLSLSSMQRSMLFEIAMAAADVLLSSETTIRWDEVVSTAIARQRQHFDAKVPSEFGPTDREIAMQVAENLVRMLTHIRRNEAMAELRGAPRIPGYGWISSGVGDFAVGSKLIEVKCTNKHFSSSDYRQVVMYWLLSYASSLEGRGSEWTHVILVNPRMNYLLDVPFRSILNVISSGRSKVELVELFNSIVESGGHDRNAQR